MEDGTLHPARAELVPEAIAPTVHPSKPLDSA